MKGRRFFLCLSAICVLTTAFGLAQMRTKDYFFELIEVPGATTTQVHSINAQEEVVGNYFVPSEDCADPYRAFTWKDGEFTYFDFPGAYGTRAEGINDNGDISGAYYTEPYYVDPVSGRCFPRNRYGFVMKAKRPYESTAVTFPFAHHELVNKINESGWMVGPFGDLDPPCDPLYPCCTPGCVHSFLVKGKTFHQLDFGSRITDAVDINRYGDVVGGYSDDSGSHGFLLHAGVHNDEDGYQIGDWETIDYPGATRTMALGINPRGNVVGMAYFDDGSRVGFIYRRGRFTVINFVNADADDLFFVITINRSRTLSGWVKCASDGKTRGFIAWPVD
jgi:hypothetical protein